MNKPIISFLIVLIGLALLPATGAEDSPRAGNAWGNPVALQSKFGSQGNFELAVPAAGSGLLYYWRDNDHDMFWNGPDAAFTDAGHFDALAMIQSNYGDPGNMEIIARRGDRLSFLYRDADPVTPWHGVWDIAQGVAGTPALIQSSAGSQGNFEVVVSSAGNGLLHFWRDNDNGKAWNGPVAFFQNWGHFDAVSLIQSNYDGHFEGIARRGDKLIMTYNAPDSAPRGRGVYLRTAVAPWGPWSAPELLASAGDAYGRWQHQNPNAVGYDDGLGEYNRRDVWGGEYGPYLVPRWFDHYAPNEFGIVYTLSSWNPYQSHLIRTVLTSDGQAMNPPPRGLEWPRAALTNADFASGDTRGWTQVGGPFAVFRGADGQMRVTTFGSNADATVGQLYQDVAIDSTTSTIKFKIHGGASQVKLIRTYNMETVRAVHALNDNDHEIEVRWNVRDYQGETVRIVIEDQETAPWGFIGVGAFHFE